jgi:16S rRNA (guanine1207-N2)-methyltransferase
MLQSRLLADTVQLAPAQHVLFLNSAANPFVTLAVQRLSTGVIILAEDNIAALHTAVKEARGGALATDSTASTDNLRHVAFHEYTQREPAATMDVAIMDLLYQPNNAWMLHGLELAAYALKVNGRLYVVGAKERGILTMAKRMQALFGNVETLTISKGHRVVSSRASNPQRNIFFAALRMTEQNEQQPENRLEDMLSNEAVFAQGKLDAGTSLLLEVLGMPLAVQPADEALDIGCGAGYLGLHIARLAPQGRVTMVDVSLLTVAVAQRTIDATGLANIRVLPSDGTQAVLEQRFDLVMTNPPFHHGGIQTTAIAERFIREAAHVLRPRGRFYLVANRFLKYEPALHTYFQMVEEVGGNTRFKVLRALLPKVHP